MSTKTNNATTKTETMAQRHARIMREGTALEFANTVLTDWLSGDMALSRMESVMGEMHRITRCEEFVKFIGKDERIGRLGKGHGWNPAMGRVTPNEITRFFARVVEFLETTGLNWGEFFTRNELLDAKDALRADGIKKPTDAQVRDRARQTAAMYGR